MRNTERLPSFQDDVVHLVRARKVFTPAQMRELLGGIGTSTYYRITRKGNLKYSELFPGGPRVHTQQQYEDYIDGLTNNPGNPTVAGPGSRFPTRIGARKFK